MERPTSISSSASPWRTRVPKRDRTLENNLKKADFKAAQSFQWKRTVEGVTVTVEFLCETDQVEAGRIYKPKEGTGSGLGAFNVRGAAAP